MFRQLLFLLLACLVIAPPAIADDRPNFVLILADDLGYGDLGCYGSEQNHTPHLDRLAAEGIRFTDFHSNGPMCTPTRAALLTGLYQHRFGRAFERALGLSRKETHGLPLQAVTIAERLKEAGYATGMFGKWHLGYQAPWLPTRQGFDTYRGLLSGDGDHHTQINRQGGPDWWDGEQPVTEDGYTADLLTRHSIDFIEQNHEQPFFVYVPHLSIHFPWQGPDDPPHRQPGTDYTNDKWGLLPDPHNVAPHVKAMVEALDRSVGETITALERLNLERKTLVIFCSDNGGYLTYGRTHSNISSNGPLRGQKTQVYEGGHRVPAIAWWPGRIFPGTCDETVMTFDLFPTLLALAGLEPEETDGVDLSGLLLEEEALPERTLFWRIGDAHAIRRGPWKLVRHGEKRVELFHLGEDLGEQQNLAGMLPDRVEQLSREYRRFAQMTATHMPSRAGE
ncbi:Arylsulfatase [Maioricimonas rarisocia]|uniref:Arylsulfatase n=1 Tax=Maioricimonas rarisocia TaxID=2528026 RepID=A0A517Z3Y1_9PLAN|nr:sulfatase-like hydrolase/transferase [Maioricimonas rarisocia]QDU37178.1 Arylsulfatase [Maioricimonas rarisocia]